MEEGLVGVSTQIMLVLAVIAARMTSGSAMSTKWNRMPKGSNTCVIKR